MVHRAIYKLLKYSIHEMPLGCIWPRTAKITIPLYMNQDNMLPFLNDKKLIYIQLSENSLNFLNENTLDKCIQSEDEFFSFFVVQLCWS